jgi:hypothetical protein
VVQSTLVGSPSPDAVVPASAYAGGTVVGQAFGGVGGGSTSPLLPPTRDPIDAALTPYCCGWYHGGAGLGRQSGWVYVDPAHSYTWPYGPGGDGAAGLCRAGRGGSSVPTYAIST